MIIIINIFKNIAKGHIDKLITAYLAKVCRLNKMSNKKLYTEIINIYILKNY